MFFETKTQPANYNYTKTIIARTSKTIINLQKKDNDCLIVKKPGNTYKLDCKEMLNKFVAQLRHV